MTQKRSFRWLRWLVLGSAAKWLGAWESMELLEPPGVYGCFIPWRFYMDGLWMVYGGLMDVYGCLWSAPNIGWMVSGYQYIYIYVYIGIAASNLHMLGQILTWSGNRRASGAAADVNIWTTNRTVFDYRISPVQTNSECKQTKLVFNGFSSSTNGEFCIAWFMYRMDSEGLASYGCPLVTGN